MEKINELKKQAISAIEQAQDSKTLQDLKVTYLGKKGPVQELMKQMKDLSKEDKPKFGAAVNELKQEIATLIDNKRIIISDKEMNEKLEKEKIDITAPANELSVGSLHPLTIVTNELEDLFISLGYKVAEGSEVVSDLYNFERANIAKDHPARDMQDTFYIDVETLLRTHTTSIQTEMLEAYAPKTPIKLVCPGKVYRRDDDDATHSHQFQQMEGLVVASDITLADLKGTLSLVAKKMFGDDREIRFRPSFFPFTEPSVEVDVSCHMCNGKGCPTCKQSGWIEILGAGMVHPKVLEMAGYDASKVTGFAFGIGIERVAMLKYGIDDIRHFYTNDVRFIEPFKRFE